VVYFPVKDVLKFYRRAQQKTLLEVSQYFLLEVEIDLYAVKGIEE
jgi:hypothetical protein